MKNKLVKVILILMVITINAIGQRRIYFCSDYTATGDPIGASSKWEIKPTGNNVYFLYNNDNVNIATPTLYVMIDKLDSNKVYKGYITKSVIPDKHRSWAIYSFKFTEAGDYKVRFLDATYHELAKEFVTIKVVGNDTKSITDKAANGYYEGSKIIFCEGIDTVSGTPISPSSLFSIGPNGSYVYVMVECTKPLNTDGIMVDVYDGKYYDNFIETKNFTVNPAYLKTYFKYTFTRKGTYKFNVYNHGSVKIQTGFVTINSN